VAITTAGLVLFFVIAFTFKACKSKSAKVDLDTVNKINNGNAAEVHKQVREMVEENAEVTTTVDNRTTIADTNVIERDRLLNEKIRVVEQKISAAKANGGNVTQEELQCLLVPSDCQ
jgi:hypothetical protein